MGLLSPLTAGRTRGTLSRTVSPDADSARCVSASAAHIRARGPRCQRMAATAVSSSGATRQCRKQVSDGDLADPQQAQGDPDEEQTTDGGEDGDVGVGQHVAEQHARRW